MVEGDSDVRYFELASKLYRQATTLQLLSKDLAIISAGTGDVGGTLGIYEEFPPLFKMIQADADSQSKPLFRLTCLFDNDIAGRQAARTLLHQYRSLRECRDVFLLSRSMPVSTSEPTVLTKTIASANQNWKDLDCEIEDLLDDNFIQAFLSENPLALKRNLIEQGGKTHYEFKDSMKGRLWLFANENCTLSDVTSIVETLKSLRFYLGLPPNGV